MRWLRPYLFLPILLTLTKASGSAPGFGDPPYPFVAYELKEGTVTYEISYYDERDRKNRKRHKHTYLVRTVTLHFSDSGRHRVYEGNYLADSGIVKIERLNGVYTIHNTDSTRRRTRNRYGILPELLALDNMVTLSPPRTEKREFPSLGKVACTWYYHAWEGLWDKDGNVERKRGSGGTFYKNITIMGSQRIDHDHFLIMRAVDVVETTQ